MSKSQAKPKMCGNCQQPIQLTENAIDGLVVVCGCRERSVKVSSVLPEEWT